jgi:alpha-glucosidase
VLSNHDVTRHVTRYGRPHTRGTGPQHEPLEPADLALGTRRARAALLLMLALPGGVYLYQGEELGLEEVEDLPAALLQDPTWHRSGHTVRGRDGCRVPLPWRDTAEPFGFSPDGVAPWLPQPARWQDLSVATQSNDADSMLSLYRDALKVRRDHKALGDGEMTWIDSPPEILLFHREPDLMCAVNLGDTDWPLPVHNRVLLASEPLSDQKLAPDTAVWLPY